MNCVFPWTIVHGHVTVPADVCTHVLLIQAQQNVNPKVSDNFSLNLRHKNRQCVPSTTTTKPSLFQSSCDVDCCVSEVFDVRMEQMWAHQLRVQERVHFYFFLRIYFICTISPPFYKVRGKFILNITGHPSHLPYNGQKMAGPFWGRTLADRIQVIKYIICDYLLYKLVVAKVLMSTF